MCGGFTCSKNSLITLNVLYVVVAITLISVAAYAKFASIVSAISLVSGIIVCGVFLLIISILGIIGTNLHHQVLLFFYMVVLFLIFIIQFSVACACLAMNEIQQHQIADQGWKISDVSLKKEAQYHFHCCGYDDESLKQFACEGPSQQPVISMSGDMCCPSDKLDCCQRHNGTAPSSLCKCPTCNQPLYNTIHQGLSSVGGVGLFFSFTEFIGVWLTVRFRNQRDPKANPSSFL